jgi:hypothetical protein
MPGAVAEISAPCCTLLLPGAMWPPCVGCWHLARIPMHPQDTRRRLCTARPSGAKAVAAVGSLSPTQPPSAGTRVYLKAVASRQSRSMCVALNLNGPSACTRLLKSASFSAAFFWKMQLELEVGPSGPRLALISAACQWQRRGDRAHAGAPSRQARASVRNLLQLPPLPVAAVRTKGRLHPDGDSQSKPRS